MIAGMFQLEDHTILWELQDRKADGVVRVTVTEGQTGAREEYETNMYNFGQAVGIALTGGDLADEVIWKQAEAAMPPNGELRWIP